MTREKPRAHQVRTEYDWAIRKFYLSAKKYSLRMAYDMMILSLYTNQGGTVDQEIPTWDSFRQYYNRYWACKAAQRHITRDGLASFQCNQRMAYGSAMLWRDKIGSYQMDETQADIYLVSQFDRSRIIGRPNIYLAVDTATQLIAGVYVGLDAGEEAVAACIANAAMDKREYCRSFGIEIEPEQWPSAGIPREVITDKGGEFLGGRMDELCVRYGIERHALPPFRPDEKGIVEKMFDLKNQRQQCRDHAVGDLELSAALPFSPLSPGHSSPSSAGTARPSALCRCSPGCFSAPPRSQRIQGLRI